jgi:hypothetical protein
VPLDERATLAKQKAWRWFHQLARSNGTLRFHT